MFKEMGDKPENQNENLDYLQHDAANMVSDTDALGKLKSGIKECPVCHARCFADMDVCYGCLHVFSEEENCAAKAKVESQKQMPLKEKTPSSSENQMVFASTDQIKEADLFEIVIKVRLPEGGNYSASLSSKNESTASSIASVVPEMVSLKRMGSESSSAKPRGIL